MNHRVSHLGMVQIPPIHGIHCSHNTAPSHNTAATAALSPDILRRLASRHGERRFWCCPIWFHWACNVVNPCKPTLQENPQGRWLLMLISHPPISGEIWGCFLIGFGKFRTFETSNLKGGLDPKIKPQTSGYGAWSMGPRLICLIGSQHGFKHQSKSYYHVPTAVVGISSANFTTQVFYRSPHHSLWFISKYL
jgi:hypothetical protein